MKNRDLARFNLPNGQTEAGPIETAILALDEPKHNLNFNGMVLSRLARNLRKVRTEAEIIEETRVKLLRKYLKNGDVELTGEARVKFIEEWQEYLAQENGVELSKVSEADLHLENVAHAGGLIRVLEPLLDVVIEGN